MALSAFDFQQARVKRVLLLSPGLDQINIFANQIDVVLLGLPRSLGLG